MEGTSALVEWLAGMDEPAQPVVTRKPPPLTDSVVILGDDGIDDSGVLVDRGMSNEDAESSSSSKDLRDLSEQDILVELLGLKPPMWVWMITPAWCCVAMTS